MAYPKIILQRIGADGARYEETVEITPNAALLFDSNCNAVPAAVTGSVLSGHGVPTEDPGVESAMYYDLDSKITYQWNDSTEEWQ